MNCGFVTIMPGISKAPFVERVNPDKSIFCSLASRNELSGGSLGGYGKVAFTNSQLFSGFDQQPRGHILLCPSWWLCCCCCCRLFVLYGDKLLFTLQATLEANQPSHCRCDFVFLHLALVKWKEHGEELKILSRRQKRELNYVFC